MYRAGELRQKEVININDASRLGYVSDVEVSLSGGVIEAIIVPGKAKLFNFRGSGDIVINWENIKVIGQDIILVDLPCFSEEK
ncbi:MAG: YlmC/YmxH family sporulation protein [Clostridia bacterium]|nr:YlmC/YmxH family sporulation protein [Clostridia bacterium]